MSDSEPLLIRESFLKKAGFWRRAIPALLLFGCLIAFRPEITLFFQWLAAGMRLPEDIFEEAFMRQGVLTTTIICFSGLFFFFAFMGLVAQFVLPVRTAYERRAVIERLFRYFLKMHGPAVVVREGIEIANPEELRSSLPGVAFVDVTSAIVLERQPFISNLQGPLTRAGRQSGFKRSMSNMFLNSLQVVLEGRTTAGKKPAKARALGPGIVFTELGERIRGVTHLRKQFRIQLNVEATTRDGFKVMGHVISIFTLGDPPPVIQVGYIADQAEAQNAFHPKNLRGFTVKNGVLTGFVDELDEVDQREVDVFARSARLPATPTPPERTSPLRTPYHFYPERVFQAVYADARRASDGALENWQDMPPKVAVEAFRNVLAGVHYSDLYMPKDAKEYPFLKFRANFSRAVRNQCVLAFQYVARKDHQPFVIGQKWDERELDFFPVQELRSPKVLRNRGISLIAASFPEIKPVNPAARQQQVDYWRAQRSKEADLILADYDYEEIRVRGRARAVAERDIVESLGKTLDDASVQPDTLALRVLQSLESWSKDPDSDNRQGREIMRMIDTLHKWMFPAAAGGRSGAGEGGKGASGSASPEGPAPTEDWDSDKAAATDDDSFTDEDDQGSSYHDEDPF